MQLGWLDALIFVGPDADEARDFTGIPNQFDDKTAKYVVFYNIKYVNCPFTPEFQCTIWDLKCSKTI